MRTALSFGLVLASLFAAGCRSTGESRQAPEDRDKDSAAFEIDQARGELRLAELERETEVMSAQLALAFAREDVAAAERALASFRSLERPHAEGESELALRQARNRLLDAEAELAELESMYADDDFAEKTKELVLARGRRSLEVARRAVELVEVQRRNLLEQELPEKERLLQRELEEAKAAVIQAERAFERARLRTELSVAKARHELTEKERGAGGGEKP
jgi:HlyD family secretion protein